MTRAGMAQPNRLWIKSNRILPGVVVALMGAALAVTAQPAMARSHNAITAPYFTLHGGKYKKVRSELRKQLKRDQVLSADAYYTLAATCDIQPEPQQSIILTLMDKSPCRDDVVDYYRAAGDRGTSEGFLMAAKRQGVNDAAFVNAQLAYQLTDDASVRDEALMLLGSLSRTLPYNVAADQRAQQHAIRLVDAGIYPRAGRTADRQMILARARQVDIPTQFQGRWVGFVYDATTAIAECRDPQQSLMIVERGHVTSFGERKQIFGVKTLTPNTVEMYYIVNGKREPFGYTLSNGGKRLDLFGPEHNSIPFYRCPN